MGPEGQPTTNALSVVHATDATNSSSTGNNSNANDVISAFTGVDISSTRNNPNNPQRGLRTRGHAVDPLHRMKALEKDLTTGKFDLIAIAALTFKDKQLWFLDQVTRLQKPWSEGCIRMEVRRDHVLQDSLSVFSTLSKGDIHKWMRVQVSLCYFLEFL